MHVIELTISWTELELDNQSIHSHKQEVQAKVNWLQSYDSVCQIIIIQTNGKQHLAIKYYVKNDFDWSLD